jgi:hypothetical protein
MEYLFPIGILAAVIYWVVNRNVRWEYKIQRQSAFECQSLAADIELERDSLQTYLCNRGDEGWELVSATPVHSFMHDRRRDVEEKHARNVAEYGENYTEVWIPGSEPADYQSASNIMFIFRRRKR